MTKFIKIAALAAATLAMTAAPMAASAQARHGGDRDHRRYEHNDRRDYRQDYRHDRRDDRRGDYRYDRRDDRRGDYRNAHRYYRGATLPRQYRSNWYIRDYNRYGYAPPPRGYGYYRTDTGDIVVAALATGVILSLLNR